MGLICFNCCPIKPLSRATKKIPTFSKMADTFSKVAHVKMGGIAFAGFFLLLFLFVWFGLGYLVLITKIIHNPTTQNVNILNF